MKQLLLGLCASLIGALATADAIPAEYAAAAPHKALAVAVDNAAITGIATGKASDALASRTALAECGAAQPDTVCEITRLNNETIATGAAIRAHVPKSPHPLFLWRFTNGPATVYLAGSIHVMKPSLYPLPKQFDAAFAEADRLVIEVNTAAIDPTTLQQTYMHYALLPAGKSLDTVLRPGTLEATKSYLAAQSMPFSALEAMKPAIVATQLAVERMTALGYLPEYGLEQHFREAAGARPIEQLETLDDQLKVLTSPELPVQDEMLLETLDQMGTIEPVIAAMVTAWLAGDDIEFRRLFDEQSGTSPEMQAFMRQLLEDRNVGMADGIVRYLSQSGTSFVLVGAAHLTGKEGIVALLAERGFQGERIRSNDDI